MSLIIKVMLSIVETSGEDTVFTLDQEPHEDGTLDYTWRAGIRGTMFGGKTCPLFDPWEGNEAFEARAETPADAMRALEAILVKYHNEDGTIKAPLGEQP